MEQEDYLEAVYNLKKEKNYIRISDIAEVLDLSKPSVTQMMQRLKKDGLVDYKPYKPLGLTAKGHKIGKNVADRHKVLSEFFTLLGVSNDIQKKDIHGIEHYLSPVSFKKLKKATLFLSDNNYKG